MELANLSPFPIQAWDSFTVDRYALGTLLVRGRYRFRQKGSEWYLVPDKDQGELFGEDEYFGNPGESPVRFPCDYAPHKPCTDVIINTHAYAPGKKPTSYWRAGVGIGDHHHHIAVFGERVWQKSWLNWTLPPAEPCLSVPVRYDYAFGGGVINLDAKGDKDKFLAFDARNPVGRGLLHKDMTEKEVLAPQIELPEDLINEQHPYHQPEPVGLGAIARTWQRRTELAGTYDDDWLASRHPYLPKDFSEKHYQDAHPGLTMNTLLTGGEQIILTHLTQEQEEAQIHLPDERLLWLLENTTGSKLYNRFSIDTVVLDIEDGLESGQAYISWRTRWPIQEGNDNLSVKWLAPEEQGHG